MVARSTGASWRRALVQILVPVYLTVIAGTPVLAVAAGLRASSGSVWWPLIVGVTPIFAVVLYVVLCGCLSIPFQVAITPGRFPRDLGNRVYGPRRLYGLCWTAVYYCPPAYHAVLAIPILKRLTLRLFGYRGALDAVFYPDTWIRDLPLLDIGPGAYIANRATLGSNICLASGDILVNRISVGSHAMVGHLAILGLGDEIGPGAEIGVGTTLGMNVKVGADAVVGAIVGINHGATIGSRCRIDSMVYIGKKSVIADGLHISYGSVVPDRAIIRTQEDADRCRPGAGGIVAASRSLEVDDGADSPAIGLTA